MASRIWEIVEASKIREGDVLAWFYMPHTDGVTDTSFRVRVTEVWEREAPEPEPLPYVTVSVAGPTGQFERFANETTGKTYRQGDRVMRMKPALAAMVSDTNYRTRLDKRPAHLGITDAEVNRFEERQLLIYRQIMGQGHDETRDAVDPIKEHVEIADVLGPVYSARKRADESPAGGLRAEVRALARTLSQTVAAADRYLEDDSRDARGLRTTLTALATTAGAVGRELEEIARGEVNA